MRVYPGICLDINDGKAVGAVLRVRSYKLLRRQADICAAAFRTISSHRDESAKRDMRTCLATTPAPQTPPPPDPLA